MNNCKNSQVLMLSLLAALFFITPFLPSSSRTTYIYFLTNVLIIGLGAEAGLLSPSSKPKEENITNVSASAIQKPAISPKDFAVEDSKVQEPVSVESGNHEKKATVMDNSVSGKVTGVVKVEKVKKCASMPSIFFIGDEDSEPEESAEDDFYAKEEEESGGLSAQELFAQAETFIGNFYNQLKMQREESWNRIHGLYQKAY